MEPGRRSLLTRLSNMVAEAAEGSRCGVLADKFGAALGAGENRRLVLARRGFLFFRIFFPAVAVWIYPGFAINAVQHLTGYVKGKASGAIRAFVHDILLLNILLPSTALY